MYTEYIFHCHGFDTNCLFECVVFEPYFKPSSLYLKCSISVELIPIFPRSS